MIGQVFKVRFFKLRKSKLNHLTRSHSQVWLFELCINRLNDNHENMVKSFVVVYNQPAFFSSKICRLLFSQQNLATEFRNNLRNFEPMTFIIINNWLNEEFKGPNQIHQVPTSYQGAIFQQNIKGLRKSISNYRMLRRFRHIFRRWNKIKWTWDLWFDLYFSLAGVFWRSQRDQ